MDYQNAEFYKLNKNNPDLVYNFADELITYRKETEENGNLQIVEYRKKDGRKGKKTTTRRVVPSHEMSIEDFDITSYNGIPVGIIILGFPCADILGLFSKQALRIMFFPKRERSSSTALSIASDFATRSASQKISS